LSAPGGAISFTDPANHFGTLKLTAFSATIVEATGADLGSSQIADVLNVSAQGAITDSGVVTAGTLALAGTTVTLDSNGVIGSLGAITASSGSVSILDGSGGLQITDAVTAAGSVNIVTAGGDLTLAGAVTSETGNVVLAIKGATTQAFLNQGGSISATDGRYLVYAGKRSFSELDGLDFDAFEGGKTYPQGPAAKDTGNVFMYRQI
jgi:hypothetical protein